MLKRTFLLAVSTAALLGPLGLSAAAESKGKDAAVVIGGTSLYGGTGGIPGTLIGALFIWVLLNGLMSLNVSSYPQQIFVGLISIATVAFDHFLKRQSR